MTQRHSVSRWLGALGLILSSVGGGRGLTALTRRYEPVVRLSFLKGRLPVGGALLPLGDLRGGHCFCHLVPSRRVELPKCFLALSQAIAELDRRVAQLSK